MVRLLIPVSLVLACFCVVALFHYGCRQAVSRSSGSDPEHYQANIPAVNLMPSDPSHQVYSNLYRKTAVQRFYEARGYRLVWVDNQGLSPLGEAMVKVIRNLRYYGLIPANYHLFEIENERRNLPMPESLWRAEALLTDAFLAVMRDLKYGQANAGYSAHQDTTQVALLNGLVQRNGNLEELMAAQEPDFPGYKALKKGLRNILNSLNEQEQVALMSGSIPDSTKYSQIQAIEVNMERWRWETEPFGDRFILVNIPSYMLYVFSGGSIELQSRVIVGTPETPTPVLSSTIECIVFYPYWHVPKSISVKEYLPFIQEDTAFLSQHNFDVLDKEGNVIDHDTIDWYQYNSDYFPVILRQREGSENSLGLIKFEFDNPYAVYLHDTNARKLFRKDVRALSHGCIRVELARELAHYLVTGKPGRTSDLVADYLELELRHTINLDAPIPVYIRYFTCEFKDNTLYRYDDIYDADRKLMEQLYGTDRLVK